jgi:DNA ligase-1
MHIQDNDLKALQEYVDEMKSTSSANAKKVILEKFAINPFICKILQYVNNPYITFGVTSKQCEKHKQVKAIHKPMPIINVLDELASRRFTGHDALHLINSYIANNPGYDDLIYSVIDRDLETRANTTLINKVMPGFIPVFKVALAQPFEAKRVNFDEETWFASRKLDGVRCVCRIDHQGEIHFYSRNGKRFNTLGTLKVDMYQQELKDIIFDGEVCIVEEDGVENFASVMKEIKKKNHTIKNPKFFIFDCLTPDEFEKGTSQIGLLDRLSRIPEMKDCAILPQVKIDSQEDLDIMQSIHLEHGYEGTMVRNNKYKGKRSYDLMKVKSFLDAEYEVVGTINDTMRWIELGEDIERETMASVKIKHKGCIVGVGSGFSKDQRDFYYKYPDEIIGKVITVQYFEEIEKKPGEYSLRFPTVKIVHGTERTT